MMLLAYRCASAIDEFASLSDYASLRNQPESEFWSPRSHLIHDHKKHAAVSRLAYHCDTGRWPIGFGARGRGASDAEDDGFE